MYYFPLTTYRLSLIAITNYSTYSTMKRSNSSFKQKLISFIGLTFVLSLVVSMFSLVHAQGRYSDILEETVTTWEGELPEGKQLIEFLEKPSSLTDGIGGGEWIRNFLVTIWVDLLIPVFVFAGIFIAIIGFYKLMFSESDEDTSNAYSYLLRWIVGTLIMVSAWFITTTLIWSDWSWWSVLWFSELSELDGPAIAVQLYQTIAYPFVKLFLSVAIGILFISLLINAMKMIFTDTNDSTSQAFTMFVYSLVWIIVISMARTIVELVYGSYEKVTWPVTDNLWDIGLLFDGTGPDGTALKGIWWVINWILGLSTLIVVCIIIYLWFVMLFKPNDEESFKKVKKYLLYALIGIFIIWFSYVISRIFIVSG